MAITFPWKCVVLTGVLLSTMCPGVGAFDGVIEIGETGKRIVEIVRKTQAEGGFSGAVLAAQDGKVIAAIAVGSVGDKDDSPLKVTSLFEIGSCTKPFTAIAVMKLVEQGKLGLDESIAEYLPGVPEDCHAITVRHLLQHTSGIPGSNTQGSGRNLAQVLPTFLEGGPRTTPGEHHEYWNQGYSLLSEIIARASGKPYTQFCRDEIFKPCKMESSRFTGERPPAKATVAIGQSRIGKSRSALEHPYGEYGFQYRGMGGLVTNLVDLWRWDRTLASGKLLSDESIEEMTRPGSEGYALGWRVTELDGGRAFHEHTGSVRGFLASIRRDPSAESCLFVLANSDSVAPFDKVRSECEVALYGEASSPTSPDALASVLVEQLIGTYRDSRQRTMTVSKERNLVRAQIDWGGPVTNGYLNAMESGNLSYDMMKSTRPLKFERMNEVSVDRDENGEVVALTIIDLEPPLRFDRVTGAE